MVNDFTETSQLQHPSLVLRQGPVQAESKASVDPLLQDQDRRQDHLDRVGGRALGRLVIQAPHRRWARLCQGPADLPFQEGVDDRCQQDHVAQGYHSFRLLQAIGSHPGWALDEAQGLLRRMLPFLGVQQVARWILVPVQETGDEDKQPTVPWS